MRTAIIQSKIATSCWHVGRTNKITVLQRKIKDLESNASIIQIIIDFEQPKSEDNDKQ